MFPFPLGGREEGNQTTTLYRTQTMAAFLPMYFLAAELCNSYLPNTAEIKKIPIRNNIATESHIVREESPDDYFSLPKEMVKTDREVCLLKVEGDSMIDANIDDGNMVLIEKRSDAKNRDIVAVSYGNKTIIKRYIPANDFALLSSENTEYENIKVENEHVRILGVTLGVIKGKGNL